MDINILLEDSNNIEIEEFEKREWPIADLEHYGNVDIDLAKRKYIFTAKKQ